VKAHCRLGKVKRPAHHPGTLTVTRLSVRHGTKLSAGTLVAVTLGGRPASHRL
jgi:hypothetical protein